MLGFRVKTKKEVKSLIGRDVSGYFQETSIFGIEYKPTGVHTVCISLDCTRVRNVFGTLTTENNILTKVK